MTNYKCFKCGKQISNKSLDKRFTCQFCGSRIFYKPRQEIAKIRAV